jgi:hypothetical protein
MRQSCHENVPKAHKFLYRREAWCGSDANLGKSGPHDFSGTTPEGTSVGMLEITVYPRISVPLIRGGSFKVTSLVGDGL